jgi:hypothetical protein
MVAWALRLVFLASERGVIHERDGDEIPTPAQRWDLRINLFDMPRNVATSQIELDLRPQEGRTSAIPCGLSGESRLRLPHEGDSFLDL